jgi:hypothetical protein
MDRAMLDRGRPLSLWGLWWNAIQLLRPAFSRLSTFMWFATIVAGMTVRVDTLGITSIVRALNLRPKLYHRLLAHFHSTGVKLDRLAALWTQLAMRLFSSPVRVNGRLVLVGDSIKIPKRGRKMPAVKLLHQQCGGNRLGATAPRTISLVSNEISEGCDWFVLILTVFAQNAPSCRD